jgi:uncharacterized membrane protein (DUF106 family)
MKHWTFVLPEAGAIKRYGDDQLLRLDRIAELKRQAEEYQKEFEEAELKIQTVALKHWTAEEIDQAKERVKETSSPLKLAV